MRVEVAADRADQEPCDQTHTDQDVQTVQACHGVVETEVHAQIRVVRAHFRRIQVVTRIQTQVELVRVLEVFNAHEDRAAKNSRRQRDRRVSNLILLHEGDGNRHRERREDQNQGVHEAQSPVQRLRAFGEHVRIDMVEDRIANQDRTEHEDLGHHEQPNTLLTAIVLLSRVFKVMRNVS